MPTVPTTAALLAAKNPPQPRAGGLAAEPELASKWLIQCWVFMVAVCLG